MNPATSLPVNLFICLMGLFLHIAMKWNEARLTAPSREERPGLVAYIRDVPAQTLIAVLGTAAAFATTWALDWMNPGMALASGYMSNSIVENIANHYRALPDPPQK